MMHKYVSLLFMTMLFTLTAWAQNTIRGTVTNVADEEPIIGATVLVKGTSTGTSTGLDGSFQLEVPDGAKTLIFSAIGMTSVEKQIGNATQINVALEESVTNLPSVVITALGQEKARDKSAMSSTTISDTDLKSTGETGILQGLSAKSAGLVITSNGGDPGAGAYIQIRGQNTISGDAQPLFVIDGMPVSNTSSDLGATRGNGIVQQSRINDINPEDIARVEVLRGAAAAAIWGTRAANGVIVITTKKGRNTDGKVNISFKSTYSIDEVNKMHPLQRSYGQGSDGLYLQGARTSFGDRIADRPGGEDSFITNPDDPRYAGFLTFPNGEQRYALAPGTSENPSGGKNSRETFDHREDPFDTGYS